MKRKLIIISLLLLLVCSGLGVFYKVKSTTVSAAQYCSGRAMCVLDSNSKRVLYSKNMYERLPMASTTKIVTAITFLQKCSNLDEYVQIDDKAIGVEGTSIYLRKGEVLKVKDLLYGLMLRSGNDAATALAIHASSSVENFANDMTNFAESIGAKNSNFANPHGLDNPYHYTTAYDLALITSYALKNPIFKEIVSTKNYVINATNKSDKRYLTNKNRLLSSLDGCCGVKTGFTSKAGRCLVSACERNNFQTVCVVLNCGPMFEESSTLLNSVYDEYKNTQIIDKNKEIYNEYYIDDNQGKLYLYTQQDFYYPLRDGEIDNIKIKYNVKLDDANINAEVGEIKIYFDKYLIKTLKLYTINKIDRLVDSNTLQINEILWEE